MSDPLQQRRRRASRVAVSGLLVLAAASGCSEEPARPGARPGSPTSAASATATSTAAESSEWVTQDGPQGVTFALPERAEPQTGERPGQDGAVVSSTEYAAAEGDVRLSVDVLTTPDRPAAVRRTVRAQYLPFLVVDSVRAQGATDAGVVTNRRVRGLGVTGFDSQLTFVRDRRKAVWFLRAVELPTAVVVAQAVAYVPVGEDAVDRVRAVFERLTEGLTVPRP